MTAKVTANIEYLTPEDYKVEIGKKFVYFTNTVGGGRTFISMNQYKTALKNGTII